MRRAMLIVLAAVTTIVVWNALIGIASGFLLGSSTVLHLAGRKVTRAEVDRVEQAQRVALIRGLR